MDYQKPTLEYGRDNKLRWYSYRPWQGWTLAALVILLVVLLLIAIARG